MTTANEESTLRMTCLIDAPRERVFEAWTNPDHLCDWHRPGEAYETSVAEVDLRVGGAYRIGMRHIEKRAEHIATGVYREVTAPERLVYTWSWEGGRMGDTGETVVTVEFHDRGAQTEVVLTHDLFASAEAKEAHRKGWTGCLGELGKVVWD